MPPTLIKTRGDATVLERYLAGDARHWPDRTIHHPSGSDLSSHDQPGQRVERADSASWGKGGPKLRPVTETGVTAMNSILNRQKNTGSA